MSDMKTTAFAIASAGHNELLSRENPDFGDGRIYGLKLSGSDVTVQLRGGADGATALTPSIRLHGGQTVEIPAVDGAPELATAEAGEGIFLYLENPGRVTGEIITA